MPTYNAGELLRPALESVLAQTHADWRLLVVDDASNDGSADMVESYGDERVRVVRQPVNGGQTAALNAGLALVESRWVARLDQDDLAAPRRAERQLAHLADHPRTVLLGTWADYIDEHDEFVSSFRPPTAPSAVRAALVGRLEENPFIHSSVVFDADAARRAGGYPATMRYAQDYGLWVRLLAHGDAEVLGETLCTVRIHPGQTSGDRAVALRMWREVLAGGDGLDDLLRMDDDERARWRRGRARVHTHMAIAELALRDRPAAAVHARAVARTLGSTPAAALDVADVLAAGVRHRAAAILARQ
jgi:glycosyltransferase involved in cell wall biosynthesis